MTNPASLKLVGPQFFFTNTQITTGNSIPTNAPAGSNANFGGTFSGYGNATSGGASLVRILNTSTGLVTITVGNNGVNVGSILLQGNTDYFLEKYPYDVLYCSNGSNTVFANPVAKTW